MNVAKLATCLFPSVLAVTLTSCCTPHSEPARFKETRTITVDHVAHSAIQVTSGNGAISVKAGDRDNVEIIADLRMITQERLDAVKVQASRDTSDRLIVRVEWPDGDKKNNEGCSFTITVPDAHGEELRTANGRIETAGLSGDADLQTSNGAIEVHAHEGDVHARTSNGPINVEATGSNVDVVTSNGRIDVRDAGQSVRAGSSNGSVEISFADGAAGPVEATSSNGSITLELGSGFAGELELSNSNGSLDVGRLGNATILSAGKHHMRLMFGDGEAKPKSRVVTSNGSIHVHQR